MPKFLAASSLGLLTGLLVGLSTSPVVVSVVSALLAMTAGVVALTGLRNPFLAKEGEIKERGTSHDWAVAAFAIMTIAGLIAGLWARTHNAFSPSPQEIVAQWTAAGLDDDVAARLAALNLTGVMITADGRDLVPGTNAQGVNTSTVLFAYLTKSGCQRVDPSRMKDAEEARTAWRLASPPWPMLADALGDASANVLSSVWAGLCDGEQR